MNEDYWRKFQPIAEAVWAKDPEIILVVGDFAYGKVITDPFHFEGGVSTKTLAAHQKILELARTHGREVWFDIHVNTDHLAAAPRPLRPERSYIEQFGKLAPGANYKVVIFEFNSGNHAQKRALSNALAINEVERVGALLPFASAANCLQPDGQNDNGWDQGLLFLNPSRVWLQPPGYVTGMVRRADQPLLVKCEIIGDGDKLSANARRSEDGKSLVLQVVNWDAKPRPTRLLPNPRGSPPPCPSRRSWKNWPVRPTPLTRPIRPIASSPHQSEWRHAMKDGAATYSFPPHSFTVIRFKSG